MQKATDVAMRQMMLADVFAAFDVDGDGFVDAGELMQLGAARQKLKQDGRKWTEAKNKQLVELLDTNKDGAVSRDEFVRGFGKATPEGMQQFCALMMEYEAVARWVRAESAKAQMDSTHAEVLKVQSLLKGVQASADTPAKHTMQAKHKSEVALAKQQLDLAKEDKARLTEQLRVANEKLRQQVAWRARREPVACAPGVGLRKKIEPL